MATAPDPRRMRALLTSLMVALPLLAFAWRTSAAPQPQVQSPHGSFKEACVDCHDANGWRPARVTARFDHGKYGFPLAGAHATGNCLSCHRTLEFKQPNTLCANCHTDPHRGEMGTDCAHCHGSRSFVDRGPMVRAHQQTRFPLTGSHASVDCEGCHKPAAQGQMQFVNTSLQCSGCHMPQYQSAKSPDHVAGGFPTDCVACHGQLAWNTAKFNHDNTAFPLTGAHTQATCNSCHGDGVYKGKSTACMSCHTDKYNTATPAHGPAGFTPQNCANCHTTTQWSGVVFDHNRMTSFALTGAHAARVCSDCHSDGVYVGKSTACASCHQSTYDTATPPHAASGFPAAICATCHNTTQWAGATFDHNTLTTFPLTGAHVQAACTSCHGDNVFKGKSTACMDCHMDKYNSAVPSHAAAHFPAANCATCHTTTQWAGATFAHDASWFPIYSGTHVGRWSMCSDCHQVATDFSSFTCLSCHPHSDKVTTDGHHSQVRNYSYDSAACYRCHPTGRN